MTLVQLAVVRLGVVGVAVVGLSQYARSSRPRSSSDDVIGTALPVIHGWASRPAA